MVDFNYGTSSYDRKRGNFPEIPVVNMFVEQVPLENKPVLQSRPGLEDSGIVMTGGQIKALYQNDGVLSNQLFGVVSDSKLYSSNTLIGDIDGVGPVSMAGYETALFMNAGASLWAYDGATLSTIAMPGGIQVLNICEGTDRVIAIDKDTGRVYWSDVLTENFNALSFNTAENSPDKLKHLLFMGDTLILFGSETVEFWPASTNPDLPYQPLPGRTFSIGIRDTGCATLFGTSFAWITNNNRICVGDPETAISDAALNAKLEASNTASLFRFYIEGTEFLAVRMDTETYVFCTASSQWSTFESYGEDNWIPQCCASGYFGSAVDGRVVKWSDDHSDFGGIMERRFRAGAQLTDGGIVVNNVIMRTNVGYTPFLSGDYANPTVEMRMSADGGNQWSDWDAQTLGAQGIYNPAVMWRSLGMFSFPGVLAEFRVTDPVPFRVSGLEVNGDYGGR